MIRGTLLGSALACLLGGCISYEPARLVPAITLSPEDVTLLDSADSDGGVDFGLQTSLNESDSLLNVEILPGVRVREVAANGPAAAAGIEVGDVILSVDGLEINHPDALAALQRQGLAQPYEFRLRRNTVVFAASVSGRPVGGGVPPRELYRIDPLATRAGYDTDMVSISGQGRVAAARIVEIFPDSPLPAAGLTEGDRILALNGIYLNSAQDLVSRLIQEHELGEQVQLTVFSRQQVAERSLRLWDPGRRLSRIAIGPLFRYESALNPPSSRLTILDFWLFSVYSYNRVEGERSHSLLGLINATSDYGELVEEQ